MGTCSLSINPTTIQQGGSATLSWHITNSSYAEIDHGIGGIDANGAITVSPSQTTTYTLKAFSLPDGTAIYCRATIVVQVPQPPSQPACTLSAHPTNIQQGSASVLSWTTNNATSVSINNGIGSVSTSGSRTVVPNQTTTYTLTATGPGGTVNCYATVTVQVPQQQPACTLTVSPSTIHQGQTALLRWTTQNATTVTLNHGLGAYPGVGETVVQPSGTTTYVLTATGPGGTVTCSATVTVIPPTPQQPACTLSVTPTTISQGSAATLSWTTHNANNVVINHGIGSVPTSGSRVVAPSVTTTYTLTATGTNGTPVNCSATVVVVPIVTPVLPSCTLSVSPTNIRPGDPVTLSWSSSNATSFHIDQGVGSVPLSGSRTVYPGGSRTYVGTASGPGGTVTCAVHVSTRSEPGPSCTMRVSPSRIDEGDTARLTWDSDNVYRVRINEGIGSVSPSGSRSVSPNRPGTYEYEGTFYGDNGDTIRCSATLRVRNEDREVVLDSLPLVSAQPLTYVALSDLPYTGLDLGPGGTMLYWLMLVLWSLAVAYVILGGALPFALRKVGILTEAQTHAVHAPAPIHAPAPRPVVESVAAPVAHAAPTSTYEAFKAKSAEEPLTIEDIVKGLSSAADDSHLLPPIPQSVRTVAAPVASARTEPTATPSDVPAFLAAMFAGDKDAVFAKLRDVTKAGEDAQEFLTHAVFALDDAYRAKTEGAPVHPEIAKVCENCAPNFLEKLIETLSTAVDSSYTAGTTAAKVAVTRALKLIG